MGSKAHPAFGPYVLYDSRGGFMQRGKRTYGTGQLSLIGNVYHVRYYDAAGIRRSESTGTDDEGKASRYLVKRLGQIAAGQIVEPKKNVGAMAKAYFNHLEVKAAAVDQGLPEPTRAWRSKTKKRNYRQQLRRWELHLEDHFAGARKVLSNHLNEYITARREEKAKDPTIQRELSLLQKILNHSNIQNPPKFPRLQESLPRQGFTEDAQFEELLTHIVDKGVRGIALLAFRYGFRKEELQNLLCRQVNLTDRTLNLYKGTTKNSTSRKIVLDDESLGAIKEALKGKGPDDYVFTWTTGNKKGKRIRDFRECWKDACKAAKLPQLLFHDLRRSAVRRMVRRGVPTLVARRISGHLTDAIFHLYDITSDQDLEEAAEKIGQKLGNPITTGTTENSSRSWP
jgi:integrase